MFVGRAELLNQIHAASSQPEAAFDLKGSPGSGKTAIVNRLEEVPGDFRPILVDIESFNPGHPGESGPGASVGAVQASFQQFSGLLQYLLDQTGADEAAETFRTEVIGAYNSEVTGRRVFSLELAMDEVRRALTPTELADAWRDAAEVVADKFLSHWNVSGAAKGVLLLLDNMDEVAEQEVGLWLRRLLPRLELTVVMFTRQPERPFPPLSPEVSGRFVQLDVPGFSVDDVKRYLERPTRRISDDMARRVHVITDGHPGTVSLVHDILWEAGLDDTGREAVLNEITSETTERVAHLAERLVHGQNDPRLSNALWAAALPRRFDASLLKALLDETEVPAGDVPEVFERLGHLPFVEDVTRPGEGPKRSWLRVHAYVRLELLDRMVRLDPERFGRLHDRAATFHNNALLGVGESATPLQYGEAFVYENPDWQRHRREWLYHRMHAQDDGQRRQALLECTRVFLDAFWWWGNYVHFDFCDQLVADLDHMVKHRTVVSGDNSWADLKNLHQGLHDLLEAYPPRSGKKDGDWPKVYNALLQIQDACAIPSKKALNDEKRKVRALIEIFIAHTWRYRDRHSQRAATDYRQAQDYYQRAQDDLEGPGGEAWSIPWVLFERADLRLERDEPDDELRRLWLEAAATVQPPETSGRAGDEDDAETDGEPDEELIANLHRLRGDLCWQTGEYLRAAGWYRRAVLHAYLFHNAGDHPDEYTLQFYVDIRARALNRLFSLVADGDQDEALRCAVELANVHTDTGEDIPDPDELKRQLSTHVDGGLADLEPLRLALTLFPVGPQVEELVSESTPFKREFLRRAEAVDRDVVARDLSDEQWP